MVDPTTALAWFGVLVILLSLFFWPRHGVLARLGKLARLSERVRLEDALKHFYKCEYEKITGSVDSLAGVLQVGRNKAVKLVAQLDARGLLRLGAEGIQLTDSGREYAGRIVRTHRLWETYLADRTGVDPLEWHERAEKLEHKLSPAEVDRIAREMGNPRFDPHGDPIPTATGEVPPATGVALTTLEAGRTATVIHLEDEPSDVYQKLLSSGLAPLARVRLLESGPDLVRFEADGRELTLEPVVAANVTVEPLPEGEADRTSNLPLSDLGQGQRARVVQVLPNLQGHQRRRLLDLGLVPGTVVEVEMGSAFGDPLAYRVRGALIALRRQQAQAILVEPLPVEVEA